MKTKREMIAELTPIEYAGMFSEETLNKSVKNWTKNGLEKMKELWHTYYTNQAHDLIIACIITYKESIVDFEQLVRIMKRK